MSRKKLQNKEKFQFQEDDIVLPPPSAGRTSFQSRLAKKADNTPCYNNNRITPLQNYKRSPAADTKPPTVPPRMNYIPSPQPLRPTAAAGVHIYDPFSTDSLRSNKSLEIAPVSMKSKPSPSSSVVPDVKLDADPVLQSVVAKLKRGLLEPKSKERTGKAGVKVENDSKSCGEEKGALDEDQRMEEIVAKLRECGGRSGPAAAPSPREVDCVCDRPLKLVMCRLCGETFRGRLRLVCPRHPGQIFLQDVTACRGCSQADTQQMQEFDLPAGMETKYIRRSK